MSVSIARVLAVTMALAAPVLAVTAPGSTAVAAATTTVDCKDARQSVAPPTRSMESYTAITPKRIVDTREGLGGHDGIVKARCTLRLDLSNSVVPGSADAVALSVTAVSDFRGFITVFQCSSGRPMPSNLNTRGDSPTPNLVVAVPEADGSVCLYAHVDMHMVIDVQGWWSDGPNRFVPVDPVRAYDSRELAGDQRLGAFQIRNVTVADEFIPDDATSVVINLTVTETTGPGWMVAYPCGETAPVASNINYIGNDTRAVAAIVKIGNRNGGDGQICFQTMRKTHFIVDVVGYHAPAGFGPAVKMDTVQKRIVDTRDSTGPWDRPFRDREVLEINPLVGIPNSSNVTAVVINAIGLNAVKQGFLTFYPCESLPPTETPPTGSTLNTLPNREVANLLTVKLNSRGTFCVLSHTAGDVVLDLVGVMRLPSDLPFAHLDFTGVDVWPKFAASGVDYAMNCGAGTNTIGVTAVPHRNRTVRVNGRSVNSDAPTSVALVADDILPIDVVAGGTTTRYHFRCLPADFPKVTVDRPGAPTPGWYLTGIGGSGTLGAFTVAFDHFGAPVWYQRADGYPINVQRLGSNSIAYATSNDSGYAAGPEEAATVINLDGTFVREVKSDDPNKFPIDYHELLQRPGGKWTVLAYQLLDAPIDLTQIGYGASEYAVNNSIREVSAGPQFNLEWEWNAIDHFDIAEVQFPVAFNIFRPKPLTPEVDLFHINSVASVPDTDGGAYAYDYLVNSRHLDAVFRVDRESGDVEWILSSPFAGGPVPNKNGAPRLTILNDPLNGPRRSHDARLNGDVLTLFDNRTGTGQPARAVAYRIDESALTATLLWQINEPLGRTSNAVGAFRVGADGARVVTWGGLQPSLNEFNAQGALQLAIGGVNSYRVVKYPVGDFAVGQLRSRAGSGGEAGRVSSALERQQNPGRVAEMNAPLL